MKTKIRLLSLLLITGPLAACGFDEIPQKTETTFDTPKEADGNPVKKPGEKLGSSVELKEVTIAIAERKTKEHFCADFSSNAACEIEWPQYLAEELVFKNFEFTLALGFEDDKLADVGCGFRSPEGRFYKGEFSAEHGVCFAFYDDYTGASGLYDLFPVDAGNRIPGNFVLFMFDAVNMHIVDSESLISFSHEYSTGKQQYQVR